MKNKLRLMTLALCCTMLIAFAVPAMAASGDTGASVSVNAGNNAAGSDETEIAEITGAGRILQNAYLYAEASKTSKKLVILSKNIEVSYLGESGDFYKLTYTNAKGKTYVGFMEKKYLQNIDAATESQQGTAARSVTPNTSTASTDIASALAAARKSNSDVIGYISISGTNIQQPILHRSSDVHYYSYRDINGKKDSAGCVYSFYNALYRNNTITGHNMRASNRLFHQLHHLQEKALGYSQCQHSKCTSRDLSNTPDIRQAANRVWDISLFGYNKWEVFAMYEVKKDEPKATLNYNIYPLASVSQTQEWINKQLQRSEVNFGVKVSTEDSFLTVYTCGTEYDSSSAQSRLYFFLKAVK